MHSWVVIHHVAKRDSRFACSLHGGADSLVDFQLMMWRRKSTSNWIMLLKSYNALINDFHCFESVTFFLVVNNRRRLICHEKLCSFQLVMLIKLWCRWWAWLVGKSELQDLWNACLFPPFGFGRAVSAFAFSTDFVSCFFFFFCHSICLKRIVPAASTDWYRCVRLCFRQRKDKKGRQKKRKTAKKEVSRNSELSKTDSFDDPFTYSFFSFSFSSSTVFFNLIGFDSTLIYLCVLCCVLDGKRIQKNVAQLGLENPTRRPDWLFQLYREGREEGVQEGWAYKTIERRTFGIRLRLYHLDGKLLCRVCIWRGIYCTDTSLFLRSRHGNLRDFLPNDTSTYLH